VYFLHLILSLPPAFCATGLLKHWTNPYLRQNVMQSCRVCMHLLQGGNHQTVFQLVTCIHVSIVHTCIYRRVNRLYNYVRIALHENQHFTPGSASAHRFLELLGNLTKSSKDVMSRHDLV